MSIDLNGPALEVALGLAFVFFLLSLIVSAGTEAIAWAAKWRARTLVKGVKGLLGDDEVSEEVLCHPLVQSDVTTPVEKRRPSYVSPRNFSGAMLEILDRKGSAAAGSEPRIKRVKKGIETVDASSPALGTQLKALYDDLEGKDGATFRKSLEHWFDDGMDRVSGWYKRWSQAVAIVIALAVAIGLNVDAVRVAERLGEEPAVRQSVVTQAQAAVEEPGKPANGQAKQGGEPTPIEAGEEAEHAYGKLAALELPILWSGANDHVDLEVVVGWLITAIAISLGAPFWFDALGKLAHLKTTGKKPEEVK
jgi:hypothetical protein